jgi:hypothetical protein
MVIYYPFTRGRHQPGISLIAAPLVSLAGYPTLFGATALVAIAASVGVGRIKSVR